ncbi:MAG: Holliday junction branch migration protein RuvA [Parachlamydiaceae bacterium]
MFCHIKGTLVHATVSFVVIDVGGVGYKIFIPANVSGQIPHSGSPITLYTSFVVREQAQTLYGFFSMQERDFFEALLGVTGIGPKIALALVGHMPLTDLQQAIVNEDTATICRIPGIGKKGAERLIIEMRDKIDVSFMSSDDSIHRTSGDPRAQIVCDAMSALINLGYNQGTAQKAMKKSLKDAPESIDLAALISTALKHV